MGIYMKLSLNCWERRVDWKWIKFEQSGVVDKGMMFRIVMCRNLSARLIYPESS